MTILALEPERIKLVEYGIAHWISGIYSKHVRLIARIIEKRP